MRNAPIALALALLAFAAPASALDMFGNDYKPCGDQASTAETVDCTVAKTKTWDQRLNAAYAALLKAADPEAREPLRKAQRIWLQYRDANCGFYGSGQGTIHSIEQAECIRAMTQDRALELQQAAQP